jgi:flagellar hook-basal body complex protein FliE
MRTAALAAGAYRHLAALGTGGGSAAPSAGAGATPSAGQSFGTMLADAMHTVVDSAKRADTQAMAAAHGHADLVDVVTAVTESQTAIQALVGVRDRVISAYQQIMQMPI